MEIIYFCIIGLLVVCMVIGYLLGSVNFAIIITKLFKKGDIRDYGSGNAGMTNVLRTVGKTAAVLTLIGDFCKGILSVFILRILFFIFFSGASVPPLFEYLVAYSALLGHVFPIYYGFKGGKGILVSAGAMLVLSPWSLLICIGSFLILTIITKYVSVGSIAAGLTFPLANLLISYLEAGAVDFYLAIFALPITIMIIYLHKPNIVRLINKNENKISFKSKK